MFIYIIRLIFNISNSIMDGPKQDIFDLYETVNLNGKTVMFRLNDIDFTGQ